MPLSKSRKLRANCRQTGQRSEVGWWRSHIRSAFSEQSSRWEAADSQLYFDV